MNETDNQKLNKFYANIKKIKKIKNKKKINKKKRCKCYTWVYYSLTQSGVLSYLIG